ncbi:MAG: hypothetical protein M1840_005167 [Geoglossum simile]|nr:MAG: hypothetical protein M1840_005167 [Geoglossum simile]
MGFGNNKKDQLKSQVENLWALNRDLNERLKDKDWRLGALEEHGTHLQDKVNNLQLLCRELTDQSRNETENSTNGVAVLNEKLRVVGQDRETLKTEIDITNAINDTLRQQLSDHIKTEQNLCEEGNELQKTVKSLRERLWISIKAIRTLKEEKAGLQVRLRYLEELVECTNGRTGGDIESFYNEKDTLRKSNANLHEQLKAHTQLIAELRSGKSALEVQHTALQRQYSILQSEASTLRKTKPRTMRSLLAIRVVEAAYVAPSLERGDDPGGPADGHWSPLGISVGKLDSPVDLEELADQLPTGTSADSFYRLLTLQICSVCTKPKLKALKNDRSGNNKLLESLDEFPAKRSYFPCCYGVVCAECMIKRTCENVESGWWHRLGSLQWVACPRKGCEEMLVIRCEGDLQGFLEMNGDTEIGAHVKMYEKALALRRALESLEPHPTPETLLAASKLHAHLQKQNYIHSFFSPRFEATEIDESGCIPDFEPGTITQADIGSRTAAKIPVFGRFFRRQAIPKTCIVCSQAKFEVAYGGVEEWEKACVEFKGKWMWDMLVFPTKRVQECEHEFEACRSCTADYIASALESTGCDRLPCPQCDRALTDSEVRRLGNSSTVERY